MPCTTWIDNYCDGVVNTEFYVEHSSIKDNIKKAYPNGSFPFEETLNEGCEWLAFVFKSQEPLIDCAKHFEILTKYSDDMLKTAYSHMDMKRQIWTRNTETEVELLVKNIEKCNTILDIGCGYGRHSCALSEKGYDVTAIDFSEKHIQEAKINNTNVKFYQADARKYKTKNKFDACFALYDVIGSFPDEKENVRILKSVYRNLENHGVFIMSVMNMELTYNRCKKTKNIFFGIENNIDKLLKLEPSNTMQITGDIFDGKKILIDEQTGTCYRKE